MENNLMMSDETLKLELDVEGFTNMSTSIVLTFTIFARQLLSHLRYIHLQLHMCHLKVYDRKYLLILKRSRPDHHNN
jgi:hypothetical protein